MTDGFVIPRFDRNRHLRYFSSCLRKLPGAYSSLDTNRLTLVHFAVQSLDLLGAFDENEEETELIDRSAVIEWIYSLYNPPEKLKAGLYCSDGRAGFKGGTFLGGRSGICADCYDPSSNDALASPLINPRSEYDEGHIAMTYTALCALSSLGDDLGRFDRKGVSKALRRLQRDDGSFMCTAGGSENDVRFLYCACAISYMINDWSGMNQDRAVDYIQSCRSYDGALGMNPGQEGHGGSTFCAIASLHLMGRLDSILEKDLTWRNDLVRWCVSRQCGDAVRNENGGMQGRPNKVEDTCYSYWIGGTLWLMGRDDLLDSKKLRSYILCCQTPMGGFSKVIQGTPDVLHSFYSLAWMSMSSNPLNGCSECDNDRLVGDKKLKERSSEKDRPLHQLDCALGIRQSRLAVLHNAFFCR